MRMTFYELKMEGDHIQGILSKKQVGNISRYGGKFLNKSQKFGKNRTSNPEDQLRSKILQRDSSSNDKIHKKMSNHIVFTLPELNTIHKSYEIDGDSDRLESYFSTRLSVSKESQHHKEMRLKYYRQLQVMKQVKNPVTSQKVFTITHMHNKQLDGVGSPVGKSPKPKKMVLPNSALDKYQIIRERSKVSVPHQLKAQKFSNKASEGVNKNQVRFKFGTTLKMGKPNEFKARQSDRFGQIEGWTDDRPGYYDF